MSIGNNYEDAIVGMGNYGSGNVGLMAGIGGFIGSAINSNGGGLFGNNRNIDSGVAGLSGYELGRAIGNIATHEDIYDATNTIKSEIGSSYMSLNNSIANVDRDVLSLGYQGQLMTKDTQNLILSTTCAVEKAIERDGAETRALINNNTMQSLRDQLCAIKTENDFNIRGLVPLSGGFISHHTPNPCNDSKVNTQIEIINQNVNQIGAGLNALLLATPTQTATK